MVYGRRWMRAVGRAATVANRAGYAALGARVSYKGKRQLRKRRMRQSGRKTYKRIKGKRGKYPVKNTSSDLHSGGSNRHVRVVLNKRLRGKSLARFKYSQQVSGLIGNSVLLKTANGAAPGGTQAFVPMVVCFNNRSQFINGVGSNYNPYESFKALYDLIPSANRTGSNVYTGSTQGLNQRLGIISCRADLQFTNFTDSAIYLDLYVCKYKQDSTAFPDSIWATSLIQEANGLASVAASLAPNAGGVTPAFGSAQSLNLLDMKPWDCHGFNRAIKILKVSRITLAAAATEDYKLDVLVNSVFRQEDFTNIYGSSQSNNAFMRNKTVFIMAIAKGSPVQDSVTSTVATQVTTSAVEIGVCGTMHWDMCEVKGQSNDPSTETYAVRNTGTSVAQQKFMNVVDAVATSASLF